MVAAPLAELFMVAVVADLVAPSSCWSPCAPSCWTSAASPTSPRSTTRGGERLEVNGSWVEVVAELAALDVGHVVYEHDTRR